MKYRLRNYERMKTKIVIRWQRQPPAAARFSAFDSLLSEQKMFWCRRELRASKRLQTVNDSFCLPFSRRAKALRLGVKFLLHSPPSLLFVQTTVVAHSWMGEGIRESWRQIANTAQESRPIQIKNLPVTLQKVENEEKQGRRAAQTSAV